MDSVQARLRKTFKHDDDDEDNDDGSRATALDDVQQESLITSLQQSAQSTDLLYTRILTLLSILAILPFFFFFFFVFSSSSSHPQHTFSSLFLAAIAVISLLLTAWITYFVPPSVTTTLTGPRYSSPWWTPFRWPEKKTNKSPPSTYFHDYDYDYLAQILTWLNLAVISLLFIVGSYSSFNATAPPAVEGRGEERYGMPLLLSLLLLLPGVMFAAVSVVRQSMADVQSGVRDLHGLKYELKGA